MIQINCTNCDIMPECLQHKWQEGETQCLKIKDNLTKIEL